jgi:hypothetical protein
MPDEFQAEPPRPRPADHGQVYYAHEENPFRKPEPQTGKRLFLVLAAVFAVLLIPAALYYLMDEPPVPTVRKPAPIVAPTPKPAGIEPK